MTARKPPGENGLPDHLARWLEAASRRLFADLRARGELEFPELRGSHRRILQMIPPQGIRITDLAGIAGMTKQSLGEFADWLEFSGFVSSGRDPSDGRVRLVRRTERGDEAASAAQRAIEAVEREWRKEVGAARYDMMKQVLREIGRDALGRDTGDPDNSAT
jgi:DNA-binding MarR family transcriptional regulator